MRWLIGAVLLPGCVVVVGGSDGDSAAVTDDVRSVGPFSSVSSDGRVDVEAAVGEVEQVVVHCPQHLVNNVTTRVTNGTLHVGTLPAGLFESGWGDCWVEVDAPGYQQLELDGSGDLSASGVGALTRATVNGSGDLEVDGIDVDAVELAANGTGDLIASGRVTTETLSIPGAGDLDATELDAVDADVTASGSGDAALTASGSVTVRLEGSGDVRISGGPAVDVDDQGEGDVILQ